MSDKGSGPSAWGRTIVGGLFGVAAAGVGGTAVYWGPHWFGNPEPAPTVTVVASAPAAPATGAGAPLPSPRPPAPSPGLTGRFQGTAYQYDPGSTSSYRMNIALHPGAVGTVVGSSHYEPGAGSCDGDLTLTQLSPDGGTADLTEAITSGGCIPYGTITVTLAADGASVRFDYHGTLHNGGAEQVKATLTRVG